MFKTLWFLFIASMLAASVSWLLDNNGSILIYWLGYEARTDILTLILLTIFFVLVVFVACYAVARVLLIRFPNFSQIFFSKTKVEKNDK